VFIIAFQLFWFITSIPVLLNLDKQGFHIIVAVPLYVAVYALLSTLEVAFFGIAYPDFS